MTTATAIESAKAKIRRLVKERISGEDEFSLPDLASEVVSLVKSDRVFLDSFLDEFLREAVYEYTQHYVAKTRNGFIMLGDIATTREGLEARASRNSIFNDWLEHSGSRMVRLMKMTREDLLAAESERRERGEREIRLANTWRALAVRLEGGQRVEEVFTVEEVEKIFESQG